MPRHLSWEDALLSQMTPPKSSCTHARSPLLLPLPSHLQNKGHLAFLHHVDVQCAPCLPAQVEISPCPPFPSRCMLFPAGLAPFHPFPSCQLSPPTPRLLCLWGSPSPHAWCHHSHPVLCDPASGLHSALPPSREPFLLISLVDILHLWLF